MKTTLAVYRRKLEERGFVTFTTNDRMLHRFLTTLEEQGVKVEVRRFESFITVSKRNVQRNGRKLNSSKQ